MTNVTPLRPGYAMIPRVITYAGSVEFERFFFEVATLVSDAATYLEEAGQIECRSLKSPSLEIAQAQAALLGARLKRISTWLALVATLRAGSKNLEAFFSSREQLRLPSYEDPGELLLLQLPATLEALVRRSLELASQVVGADRVHIMACTGRRLKTLPVESDGTTHEA